jgi:hypothetical protein
VCCSKYSCVVFINKTAKLANNLARQPHMQHYTCIAYNRGKLDKSIYLCLSDYLLMSLLANSTKYHSCLPHLFSKNGEVIVTCCSCCCNAIDWMVSIAVYACTLFINSATTMLILYYSISRIPRTHTRTHIPPT